MIRIEGKGFLERGRWREMFERIGICGRFFRIEVRLLRVVGEKGCFVSFRVEVFGRLEYFIVYRFLWGWILRGGGSRVGI